MRSFYTSSCFSSAIAGMPGAYLTGLETPEDERWEYKYDLFGRRISKRCNKLNNTGTDFTG
ncbi:hypothetical protein [Superficieibacter sp. HKU1]|uniref:hypothetical protein n=1 Tax=Superficieibacter sp. HKU1 TaxID=3031919 RepID=UPI0023E181FE|nr:hypothetical protein [Superficieibacter sp. HKU1]WES68090.1 hypothetical protein P0H77_21225 [Superficieibacter sp. HKU1]